MSEINRHDDVTLAKRYINKFNKCVAREIDWQISFSDYKRLMKIKRCQYTGMELTDPDCEPNKPTDRTIDRINAELPYTKDNIIICCHAANSLKAVWEDNRNPLTNSLVYNMMNKINQLEKRNA